MEIVSLLEDQFDQWTGGEETYALIGKAMDDQGVRNVLHFLKNDSVPKFLPFIIRYLIFDSYRVECLFKDETSGVCRL